MYAKKEKKTGWFMGGGGGRGESVNFPQGNREKKEDMKRKIN
jgi:hypothetical protein